MSDSPLCWPITGPKQPQHKHRNQQKQGAPQQPQRAACVKDPRQHIAMAEPSPCCTGCLPIHGTDTRGITTDYKWGKTHRQDWLGQPLARVAAHRCEAVLRHAQGSDASRRRRRKGLQGLTSNYVATNPSSGREQRTLCRACKDGTDSTERREPDTTGIHRGDCLKGGDHGQDSNPKEPATQTRGLFFEEEGCYTGYSSDYVATEPSCVWTQPAREGGRPYKPHPSKKPVTHTQCAFRSRKGLMYTGGTERALTALLARACRAAIGSRRCNRSQRRTPPHNTYATTCTVGVRGTASEEPPVSLGCLHASKDGT